MIKNDFSFPWNVFNQREESDIIFFKVTSQEITPNRETCNDAQWIGTTTYDFNLSCVMDLFPIESLIGSCTMYLISFRAAWGWWRKNKSERSWKLKKICTVWRVLIQRNVDKCFSGGEGGGTISWGFLSFQSLLDWKTTYPFF